MRTPKRQARKASHHASSVPIHETDFTEGRWLRALAQRFLLKRDWKSKGGDMVKPALIHFHSKKRQLAELSRGETICRRVNTPDPQMALRKSWSLLETGSRDLPPRFGAFQRAESPVHDGDPLKSGSKLTQESLVRAFCGLPN